ncbi:MAG: hypothetical protein OEX97_13565 [Acidimicrobiia bacterium]|nr:hypothetical protein [Gemmatimonadota bacterium]MDH5373966.1 hypothetical protein [Acidimicrobiia bacterium]
MRDEEPTWRPVGDVTMLTGVTVQSVEFAREHLDTIREAGSYRLDDATVARMLRMWHDTSDLNQVFAEQGGVSVSNGRNTTVSDGTEGS